MYCSNFIFVRVVYIRVVHPRKYLATVLPDTDDNHVGTLISNSFYQTRNLSAIGSQL